ncbi:MAG: hypothetical protein ACRD8A_17900 [Candidatus Acidiferrales bacterium]
MPIMKLRVIRFPRHADGTASVVTFLAPYPKGPSAKVKSNEVERNVSAEDTAKFLALLDSAEFWEMPTVKLPDLAPPKYYTVDGAFWVFEGVRNGAYHVVYRLNPNASPFTDVVYFLAQDLAGLDNREIPRGIWPPLSLLPPNQSVAIQIPGPVTAGRPFALRVVNQRPTKISFCVAWAGAIVAIASPAVPSFDVQRHGPKKWDSLLSEPDIGPCCAPTELRSEKSQEFRMKISEPGRYRLRLYYVTKSLPNFSGVNICPNLDRFRGAKVVTSDEFDVLSGN